MHIVDSKRVDTIPERNIDPMPIQWYASVLSAKIHQRERERNYAGNEWRDDRRENRVTVHTPTRRPTRRPKRHSLGAKFKKADSFWVRLAQKVTKVWYVHMTGKYSWNINRVGVEVDRAAKFLKWGMFKGTLKPQRLYIFNPRLLITQTTIAINNF